MACNCTPQDALMMIDFYDGTEGTDAVLIVCSCTVVA